MRSVLLISLVVASTVAAAMAERSEHAPKRISKRGLHDGHVGNGHGPGYGYGHGYGHGDGHGYGYGNGGVAFGQVANSFATGPLHHHVPTSVVSKIVKAPITTHHQVPLSVSRPLAVQVKKLVAVAHPVSAVVVEEPVGVPVFVSQPNRIVTPLAVAQPSLGLSLGVASSPSSGVSRGISGQPAASYGVPEHLTLPATSYGVPSFDGHLTVQPAHASHGLFADQQQQHHLHHAVPASSYGFPKINFIGGGGGGAASSGVALGSVTLAGAPSPSSFGTSAGGYSYPVPSKKFL